MSFKHCFTKKKLTLNAYFACTFPTTPSSKDIVWTWSNDSPKDTTWNSQSQSSSTDGWPINTKSCREDTIFPMLVYHILFTILFKRFKSLIRIIYCLPDEGWISKRPELHFSSFKIHADAFLKYGNGAGANRGADITSGVPDCWCYASQFWGYLFLGEDKQVPTASENREVRMEGGEGEGEG